MIVREVSRGAAITDDGDVFTGLLEADSWSQPMGSGDERGGSGVALSGLRLDPGPRRARPSGGLSSADVAAVGS